MQVSLSPSSETNKYFTVKIDELNCFITYNKYSHSKYLHEILNCKIDCYFECYYNAINKIIALFSTNQNAVILSCM